VRAVLRNPVKGGEWKNKGAEVAVAELHDAASLENAFKNTKAIFVMTNSGARIRVKAQRGGLLVPH